MSAMQDSKGEIFVVDDDPAVRQVLAAVLSRAGYAVACYGDGAQFLAGVRHQRPVCLILDVHIPGKSGLDILKELGARDYPAPIFIMSGHGDIPMAVEAIKNGAFDFMQKPFRAGELVERISAAIEACGRKEQPMAPLQIGDCEPLTNRERQVLDRLVSGASNKIAGRELGISPRTIEVHRARIMDKLKARNIADLTRMVLGGQRVA